MEIKCVKCIMSIRCVFYESTKKISHMVVIVVNHQKLVSIAEEASGDEIGIDKVSGVVR